MVSSGPDVGTKTILLIVSVFPFIVVGNFSISIFLPFSFAMLQSFIEISDIKTTVTPLILTLAVWCSFTVLTTIWVSTGKGLGTSTMLHELEPLTFVFVAIWPEMNSLSMRLRIFPFSDVLISLGVLPKSLSVFHSFDPLSVIDLTISPLIDASTVSSTVFELTSINMTWHIPFVTLTISGVSFPISFVESIVYILHYSEAISHLAIWLNLTHIESILVFKDFVVG